MNAYELAVVLAVASIILSGAWAAGGPAVCIAIAVVMLVVGVLVATIEAGRRD